MNSPFLKLKGVRNFRDLSYIEREDGKRLIPNRFYRGGNLSRLNASTGFVLANKYHVSRVLDLRTEEEMQDRPDFPIEGVEIVHIPFLNTTNNGVANQGQKSLVHEPPDMIATYAEMGSDKWSLSQMAKALHQILDLEEGAAIWHCSAGKDRTGILTSLLLKLFGFSEEAILKDYLLSNKSCAAFAGSLRKRVIQETGDKAYADKVYHLFVVDKSYLDSFYKALIETTGSLESFYADYCGFTPEFIGQIQKDFLV